MPQDLAAGQSEPQPAPTVGELFLAFLTLSLSGFGGVLPWARRLIVEKRKWMSADAFNEAFALCQFLPGPNMVNFSIVFGARFRGAAGAAAAFVALLGPPVVIVTAIGFLYSQFGDVEALRRILAGVTAAAAGLIIAMTAKMATPLVRGRLGAAPAIALIVFAAVGLARWPLPWVLIVLAPISVALAWWMRR
jgi:chromate transporter